MPLVFHSGSEGSKSHRPQIIDVCDARLLSCHPDSLSIAKKWLAEAFTHPRAKQRFIMLDSGAYTAWTSGKRVDLKPLMRDYDALVERYSHYFGAIYMVNLDIIPGSPSRTPTQEEVEAALVESDRNLLALQNEFGGEFVLPVYHQGEDLKRLQEVAQQAPFIGISPRNNLNDSDRVPWARLVHDDIAGKATHGFGGTGAEMMSTVPFYSVDSSSWVQQAGNGGIFIQTDQGFRTVKTTARTRGKPGHYDDASRHIQEMVEAQAEALGLSIDDLRTKCGAREVLNIVTLNAVSSRRGAR